MKNMKFDFLGISFDSHNLLETLDECEVCIARRKPCALFTPNAELIVRASSDSWLKKVYNTTHLVTIDSWVVYYAARLLGKPVIEPASGANIMFQFLLRAEKKDYGIYLLGATSEVVEQVAEKLKNQYPLLRIVGWHHGYFDKDNPKDVIKDIAEKKPDVLFVAMSTPYKEKFVSENMDAMQVPLSIGVGGSFDIIAGKCKHAPKWISKIGMEWFYRFIQEPRRLWKRYFVTNTLFIGMVIKEIFILFKKEKAA